jgi:hypothetical protein
MTAGIDQEQEMESEDLTPGKARSKYHLKTSLQNAFTW